MKDSNYFKDKIHEVALTLSGIKWWRPAIFCRIILIHYVREYLKARQSEIEEKEFEIRAKIHNEIKSK